MSYLFMYPSYNVNIIILLCCIFSNIQFRIYSHRYSVLNSQKKSQKTQITKLFNYKCEAKDKEIILLFKKYAIDELII